MEGITVFLQSLLGYVHLFIEILPTGVRVKPSGPSTRYRTSPLAALSLVSASLGRTIPIELAMGVTFTFNMPGNLTMLVPM